jgi:hypothetical protein
MKVVMPHFECSLYLYEIVVPCQIQLVSRSVAASDKIFQGMTQK